MLALATLLVTLVGCLWLALLAFREGLLMGVGVLFLFPVTIWFGFTRFPDTVAPLAMWMGGYGLFSLLT